MSSFSQFFSSGGGGDNLHPSVRGNVVTGAFGTGENVQWFTPVIDPNTGNPLVRTFIVPVDTTSVRVRLWGGGGTSGGGFAIKVVTGLTPGSSITVTLGKGGGKALVGGTTSFGSHVSATGGSTTAGGVGVGGDFISRGGVGSTDAGGGAAGIFGDGGLSAGGSVGGNGNAGAGSGATFYSGGNGVSGRGGNVGGSSNNGQLSGDHGIVSSLDYVSTGGGGGAGGGGANGGGGGVNGPGGFPGGGSEQDSSNTRAAHGLVIVEW